MSAGTFQPIKVENPVDHPMHSEQIVVSKQVIQDVLDAENVVSVGTTSMRTLESLYWFGRRILQGNTDFSISKLEIYEPQELPTKKGSIQCHSELDGANQ